MYILHAVPGSRRGKNSSKLETSIDYETSIMLTLKTHKYVKRKLLISFLDELNNKPP